MFSLLRQPRYLAGTLFVLVAVAVCVRLGFWQLSRLEEKQASNVQRVAIHAAPPVTVPPADENVRHEQRATVRGTFTAGYDFILLNRSYRGDGGVEVVSPFRLESGAWLLVNRGWIPQAFRDAPPSPVTQPVTLRGYLYVWNHEAEEAKPAALQPRQWIFLDAPRMAAQLRQEETFRNAEFLPYGFMMTAPVTQEWLPRPRGFPELDEGPHASYAAQWFFFAFVFLAGWSLILFRAKRKSPANQA